MYGGTQGEDQPCPDDRDCALQGKATGAFQLHVCLHADKVAGERHGITALMQRGGIVDFGFLGSQNSLTMDHGGGGGSGRNAPEQQGMVEENDDLSEEEEED